MKILLLVLFFIPTLLLAEEYIYYKNVNSEILLSEFQQAGIDLEGQDQIGYIERSGDKVKIIITDDGLNIKESDIEAIVNNHQYKTDNELKIEKQNKKKQKEQKIKQKLNLSDQEFQDLREALKE